MMMLKCLSQGSVGNCYVLNYNGEMLLLDAGIKKSDIIKGVDYNVLGIRGAFITHCHTDHSKAVNDLKNMGIKVITPYTEDNPPVKYTVNPFIVQIFPLPHNGVRNYGFYIKIADRRILYITDCEYVPQSFRNVKPTDVIVECNYQDEYLDLEAVNILHKSTGHCSLDTCKKFIEHNVTDELKTVILTHLGVESCNGNECVSEIKKVVPDSVMVDYAQAGRTWYLE